MATTTGFKVQCPSCEAMVTIKNATLVGKKIDCPKCKYRFVVEAPADLDEETAEVLKGRKQGGGTAVAKKSKAKAAVDDDDDDDDGPAKKKKKKSPVMLIVGIFLVVATLGVVGAYLGGVFDSDDKPAKTDGGDQPKNPPKGTQANNTKGGNEGAPPENGGNGNGGNETVATENSKPAAPAGGGGGALPPLARADVTNLLPNDAQWVLDVDVPKVLGTVAGGRVFQPDKQTGELVKNHFGLPVTDIKHAVASGGGDGSWTFTLVESKGAMNIDAMKDARGLGEPVVTIMRRDYYLSKENPV